MTSRRILLLALTVGAVACVSRKERPERTPTQTSVDLENLSCCQDLKNPEVRDWVARQHQRTRSFLDSTPLAPVIDARLQELSPKNPPVLTEVKGRLFSIQAGSLWLGQGEQRRELIHGTPKEFKVVGDFRVSPDGKKVAYAWVKDGSDVQMWSVLDVDSGQDISGPPMRVRLENLSWDLKSAGVFYSRWPDAEAEYQAVKAGARRDVQVWYRPLNSDGSRDEMIFKNPERIQSSNYAMAELVAGTKYLAYRVQGSAEIPLMAYVIERKAGKLHARKFFKTFKHWGRFLGATAKEALFRSSECGDHYCIVAYTFAGQKSREIVGEWQDNTLIAASFFGDRLALQYLTPELHNVVRVVSLTKSAAPLLHYDFGSELFGKEGSLSLFSGIANSDKTYFTASSMVNPPMTFEMSLRQKPSVSALAGDPVPYDGSKIVQRTMNVRSLDGTVQFPVRLYTQRGQSVKFVYLFFYGSIGIAQPSWWNRKWQAILEMGGAVAIASIRGGGEFGLRWTLSSKVDRLKEIEDIVAASRSLRGELQLEARQIVISGRSFGGMHTLAAMVHFPDEFGGFTPTVPSADVPDFLTRGLFGQYAADDFGFHRNAETGDLDRWDADLEKTKEWSPLQNLWRLKQPKPVIVFTADTDERVGTQQAIKVTHALQRQFGEGAPVFFWEQSHNGHNARAEYADELKFIAKIYDLKSWKKTTEP